MTNSATLTKLANEIQSKITQQDDSLFHLIVLQEQKLNEIHSMNRAASTIKKVESLVPIFNELKLVISENVVDEATLAKKIDTLSQTYTSEQAAEQLEIFSIFIDTKIVLCSKSDLKSIANRFMKVSLKFLKLIIEIPDLDDNVRIGIVTHLFSKRKYDTLVDFDHEYLSQKYSSSLYHLEKIYCNFIKSGITSVDDARRILFIYYNFSPFLDQYMEDTYDLTSLLRILSEDIELRSRLTDFFKEIGLTDENLDNL